MAVYDYRIKQLFYILNFLDLSIQSKNINKNNHSYGYTDNPYEFITTIPRKVLLYIPNYALK